LEYLEPGAAKTVDLTRGILTNIRDVREIEARVRALHEVIGT